MSTALQIIMGLMFFFMALVWLLYTVEAFKQNVGQGLLLFVPFYVFYFMFVRSRYTMARAGILTVCTFCFIGAAALRQIVVYA